MQDLRGNFAQLPLAQLLSWLRNNQYYGILRISGGRTRKEFKLRKGVPCSFRSNLPEEQLENILAAKGVAALEFLHQLRKECRGSNTPFTEALLMRGLLPKAELRLWLKQSLIVALDSALAWPEGHFMFRFLEESGLERSGIVASQPAATSPAAPEVREILEAEKIFSVINDRIVDGNIELPPMPDTLIRVRECLNQPDWDSQDLLKIIMADQLLTSSILKAANSSRYGLASRVSSLQHAIVLMGMKTIWGIVTHQSLLGSFSKEKERIQQVLDHSFLCALLARLLAGRLKLDEEDAFTCGLLHDMGKAVLLNQLADEEIGSATKDLLIDRFHAETGQLIAAKWNLPEVVQDVIAYHHQPDRADTNASIVELVGLADCLAKQADPKNELADQLVHIDLDTLDLAELVEQAAQLRKSLEVAC